ncbi:glutaredoxin-C6-like isoform X2 [Raphanus sativus]|uniref:Glutaredoxin-C6-like isoform X2 n=1 Tax=Raphanus sativus TaxID=3726 RepID=A0A6J0N2Q6_RAPSA|nr:glutaredoxin-C6-like isoform X2 [Raphanus sativus]
MMQELSLELFSNDVVRLDLTPPQTSPTSLSIDEEESPEAKIRRLISEHPVIIFSRSSCCMSHVMKRLLTTIGVVPTVIELDDHEVSSLPMALEEEYSGGGSVVLPSPAVFIGRECVGGFESLVALHLSGHLVPKLVQVGALRFYGYHMDALSI